MAQKLPYFVAPGTVTKILDKIKEARQPDIFTQDFLSTKLGFKGGNARPIIPLMKKMGFLNSDGSPTELYSYFRNDSTSGWATAVGIKSAYSELYDVNEYAHDLSRNELTNLVLQLTGLEKDNKIVSSTVSTYENLKAFADFDAVAPNSSKNGQNNKGLDTQEDLSSAIEPLRVTGALNGKISENVGFNISYTINLNLPETKDVEVFNAIFKSLKENLLQGS